jgi:predicted chitinase
MVQPYESENGWRPRHAGADILNWIRVPGAEHVSLQLMKGPPTTLMRAFAADFHANVEPLRDADSAGFTPTNKVATSNHLNGTGMDLNWNGPSEAPVFRYGITGERAYPGGRLERLRDLLVFYEDIIYCGGFWSIRDWMHFQMGYNTWGNHARIEDFIRRKIRPDGLSTYKRGTNPVPVPKPPSVDRVKLLADVMWNVPGVDYAALLPFMSVALKRMECTNNNRIAMACAQLGHESVGLKYMREIWGPTDQQLTYQGRMGNNNPGDGERYMGRGPIQVTGKDNYRKLSQWAHHHGYVPTETYFVDNPTHLERYEYAFMGAVWYWTTQPSVGLLNRLSDEGNIEDASKAINAPAWIGTADRAHGIQKRIERWNKARNMDLMPLIGEGEDELAGVDADRLNRAVDKILGGGTMPERWDSRSIFAREPGGVDDTIGMVLFGDGNGFNTVVILGALVGVEEFVDDVKRVAKSGPAKGTYAAKHFAKEAKAFAKSLEPLCGSLAHLTSLPEILAGVKGIEWVDE